MSLTVTASFAERSHTSESLMDRSDASHRTSRIKISMWHGMSNMLLYSSRFTLNLQESGLNVQSGHSEDLVFGSKVRAVLHRDWSRGHHELVPWIEC